MERDRIQTVLLESEARYRSDLDELLRENRFLAETLKQHGCEIRNETNGRNTHAYRGERESAVKVSERNKTSMRELLENSLIMPESTVEADMSLHGSLFQRL
ncbi:hypothetical protein LSM04_000164 [Trypanosoma melophagium]|uniref:uncharacterized protein n=1 Tax=Trypanosoma melophagium TaxID=715481 RepID=UPI00351A2AF1|nr:hypothetical protein LSM04_000164 [Trypanosoma melophagium]